MIIDDRSGLSGCRPILFVESVARSIDYYVGALGFRLGWAWCDNEQRFLEPSDEAVPTFALVARGLVQLMLAQKGQGAPGMWLHLDVHTAEHVDTLCEEWTRTGANILAAPSLRPWGMYEMRVCDLDNHVLRVSAPPPKSSEADAPPDTGRGR